MSAIWCLQVKTQIDITKETKNLTLVGIYAGIISIHLKLSLRSSHKNQSHRRQADSEKSDNCDKCVSPGESNSI